MFARACLGKKSRKRLVATADGQATRHRTIELFTMFEAVEILEDMARLGTALAKMY